MGKTIQPRTASERRLKRLRESGYTGPVDDNGRETTEEKNLEKVRSHARRLGFGA